MRSFFKRASTVLADESGQDLIEYALVACFIGLGAVFAMRNLASAVGSVFSTIGTTLTNAT